MNTGRKKIKFNNLSKACSFYAGEGHFLSITLPYLIDKIEKGSKVLLFIEDCANKKLPEVVSGIKKGFNYSDWQENAVIYPVESALKIDGDRCFSQHIRSMVELLSHSCSEQGIVICIQKADYTSDQYIKKIEDLILGIPTPVHLISCYEFTTDKEAVRKVLSNHTYILNTAGISTIEKVYPDISVKVLA